MGQYYKAIILDKVQNQKSDSNDGKVKAHLHPFDYCGGQKLTEHSFIDTPIMVEIERLMNRVNGEFASYPLVWGGDYADVELNCANPDERVNLFYYCKEHQELARQKSRLRRRFRYCLNDSKKLFIDLSHYQKDVWGEDIPEDEWVDGDIHPLPILCCEGNGRGGGDYHGTYMALVGSWARDCISFDNKIPEGYQSFEPRFKEGKESIGLGVAV